MELDGWSSIIGLSLYFDSPGRIRRFFRLNGASRDADPPPVDSVSAASRRDLPTTELLDLREIEPLCLYRTMAAFQCQLLL
jgi:hypothetical protein